MEMDEREATEYEEKSGWGTAGVGLLVALLVIAVAATAHSIWFTLLR